MKKVELWNSVNTCNTLDLFENLYMRWQEEKQYEDIADYLKAIQNIIPCAYKILKRPFSVICKCDNGDIQIGIKINSTHVQLFAKAYKEEGIT